MNSLYKKMLPEQSEFDHQCAAWARNHMGWSKMRKFNRRLTKRRVKRELDKQMKEAAQAREEDSNA